MMRSHISAIVAYVLNVLLKGRWRNEENKQKIIYFFVNFSK